MTIRFVCPAMLLVPALVAGCAAPSTQLAFDVTRPPRCDLGGRTCVAVSNFAGADRRADAAAPVLIAKLDETKVFKIVERQGLKRVVDERTLDGRSTDELLVAQAIIEGDVLSYQCDDRVRPIKEDKQKQAALLEDGSLDEQKKKRIKQIAEITTQEVVDREATVSVVFRVVDAKTSALLGTGHATHSVTKTSVAGSPPLPQKEEILNDLLNQCMDDVVRDLTVHRETYRTAFALGGRKVNAGIRAAQAGNWQEAQQTWEAEVKDDPQDHAAWYNLGLLFERKGDYTQAETSYQHAVTVRADSLYQQGLNRVKQSKNDQARLPSPTQVVGK